MGSYSSDPLQSQPGPPQAVDLADFSVGEVVVRPPLGQIVDGERTVHVEPRSIDVLIALVERAGEVWPKKELIEAVWGAAFVSDEVLTHAIWDLRRAFGDDASHPRYIQTIPKRGYRLIAPVKALEPEPAARSLRAVHRYAAAAAVAAAALGAVVIWWPKDPAPLGTKTDHPLLLVRPAAGSADAAVEQRLYDDLLAELAGAQGLDVIPVETCEPVPEAASTLCLTVDSRPLDAAYELLPGLSDAQTGELVWAPARPPVMAEAAAGSRDAARKIEELVKAYLRIVEMEFYADDDIKPWFDFSRHDTLAIGDFLEGIYYVYTNQQGGRTSMDLAAARDSDFIAPRVWRIPTLVADQDDPELLQSYVEDLRRLYPDADAFEGPMIKWALAAAEGNIQTQLLELEMALKREPGNRPVRFTLGATRFDNGNLEGAWDMLEPLVEQRWRFPGLYTAAASCAILLGLLEEAREILEYAASRSPVDAESLELLELLALYDDDPAAASRHRRSKLTRLAELDEPYAFEAAPFAAKLAAMADSEARDEVAARLREFSD